MSAMRDFSNWVKAVAPLGLDAALAKNSLGRGTIPASFSGSTQRPVPTPQPSQLPAPPGPTVRDGQPQPPVFKSITITPANPPPLVAGKRLPLHAMAQFSSGPARNVTGEAIWTPLAPTAVLSIDSNGLVTAIGQGKEQVTALYKGFPASIDVTVTAPLLKEQNGEAWAEYRLCDEFYKAYGEAVKKVAEAKRKPKTLNFTDAVNGATKRLEALNEEIIKFEDAVSALKLAVQNTPKNSPQSALADEAKENLTN